MIVIKMQEVPKGVFALSRTSKGTCICWCRLVSERFSNEDNLDPAPHGSALTSCYNDIAADTGIAVAVCASSGNGTRSLKAKPDAVWRCCNIADSGNSVFCIAYDLVHSDDHNDMFWPVTERAYPVAGSINIDQFAV